MPLALLGSVYFALYIVLRAHRQRLILTIYHTVIYSFVELVVIPLMAASVEAR
jgi:hypothetical protein